MTRIFYSGTKNASSWAFRAWLALREQGIDFEERIVDIRKPQRFTNLAEIGKFSPPGAVPVLVDDDIVIFDSLAIMEYANELGGGSLLPDDIRLRAHTRSLLSWQHSGLSGICPRLSFESVFYSERGQMSEAEIINAAKLFKVWEHELQISGGPYLVGALSLADLAFVPTILRIHAYKPNLQHWPLTQAWIELVISRNSVQEWLNQAKQLPPVFLED